MRRRQRPPRYDSRKPGLKWPLVVAFLAAATLAAAAFGSGWWTERTTPKRGLTTSELRWVRAHSRWAFDEWFAFEDAHAASGGAIDLDAPEDVFETIGRCSSTLADVGDAPTASLEDAEDASEDACKAAAEAWRLFRERGRPGPVLVPPLDEALASLYDAFIGIDEHLLFDSDLPLGDVGSAISRVEPTLTHASTAVIGRELEVRCWSRHDWGEVEREFAAINGEGHFSLYGVANVWEDRANLSPETCGPLLRFAYDTVLPRRGPRLIAFLEALLTYGHELEHVAGRRFDELEVECHALQDARAVMRALGASTGDARRMARLAWTNYREGKISKGYLTPKCRPRGAYDVDPETAAWP